MKTGIVTYRIEFKDSMGWYCPGEPWCNPDTNLIVQWGSDIKEHRSKDVRIIAFIDGKLAHRLCIKA